MLFQCKLASSDGHRWSPCLHPSTFLTKKAHRTPIVSKKLSIFVLVNSRFPLDEIPPERNASRNHWVAIERQWSQLLFRGKSTFQSLSSNLSLSYCSLLHRPSCSCLSWFATATINSSARFLWFQPTIPPHAVLFSLWVSIARSSKKSFNTVLFIKHWVTLLLS